MMDLILGVAGADERVRAVYMNGSRANPNAPKDEHQDYDVVYVVTEIESFLADKEWIAVFGELAIVQEPIANDLSRGEECDCSRSYNWLMLFKDGTRIDLGMRVAAYAEEEYLSDALTVPLLDKDGTLPEIPAPHDGGYWIAAPDEGAYHGCCNNFWWCLNNVAKGIVRDQMPYAMRMYSQVVHGELDRMVEWYIGVHNGFSVTSGMWGKYFKKYLPVEIYEDYIGTYSDGGCDNLWTAVDAACDLFHKLAREVADYGGFSNRRSEEDGIRSYLKRMREGK